MNMIFDVAAMSDMGLVRKNNEDNLFVPGAPMKERLAENYSYSGKVTNKKAFFCICDGMGGHNAGEIASDIAVNQVKLNYGTIVDNVSKVKELEAIMSEFVKNANLAICDFSDANPECANMGTTMCGIFFMNGTAYCVNVGDSRLYYLKGSKAVQLSIDHADTVHTNAITRYLGMPEEYGDVTPDVGDLPVKIGTKKRFLLCSDGLSDMLKDDSIATILDKSKTPSDAARKLIEEAKRMGGRDNITVVVIDAKPRSAVTRTIKSPVFAIILAAAIIAGGAGGYMYYKASLPVEGVNLAEAQKKLANTRSINDAKGEIEKFIQQGIEAVKASKGVYNQRPDVTDEKVAKAREELNNKITATESAINAFQEEINVIIENGEKLPDEDVLNKLKGFDSTQNGMAMVTAVSKCMDAKTALTNAFSKYDKEQQLKQQKEQLTSGGNKSGGNSGGSSSGGSTNNSGGGGSKPASNPAPKPATDPAPQQQNSGGGSGSSSSFGGEGRR